MASVLLTPKAKRFKADVVIVITVELVLVAVMLFRGLADGAIITSVLPDVKTAEFAVIVYTPAELLAQVNVTPEKSLTRSVFDGADVPV